MKCKAPFFFIILVLAIISTGYSLSAAQNNLEMNVEGDRYVLEYSYSTKCSRDLIISILYDYSHLSRIATRAKSITLVEQGADWNILQYEYSYFGYNNRLTYLNTLEPGGNIIRYEIIDFWQNRNILPVLVSAKGYWEVVEGPESNTIYNFQENFFEKPLGSLAKLLLPKETKSFLKRLEKYIKYMEGTAQSPTATEPAPTPAGLE